MSAMVKNPPQILNRLSRQLPRRLDARESSIESRRRQHQIPVEVPNEPR